MPTPHDVQEPCPTLESQCREERTFKASREAIRQKSDGFGSAWGEGGEGSSNPPIISSPHEVIIAPSQDQIDQTNDSCTVEYVAGA
jgi:hypothetical protein